MQSIIRRTLAERLLRSEEAMALVRDLSEACGVPVRFADALGREMHPSGFSPDPPLCAWMRSDRARGMICTESVNSVLGMASGKPACLRCPLGLREAAVPLRLGARVFGYLLVGQVAEEKLDRPTRVNAARHALERRGLDVEPAALHALLNETTVIEPMRFDAVLRLAERAARRLGEMVGEGLRHDQDRLPRAIEKACALIRAKAADERVSLTGVADAVGLTPQHLSTLFHRSTGMRFTEYVSRLRVEEATHRLCATDDPVTDIAYSCGFQSLSRFNRVFRDVTGMSPREYRSRHTREETELSANS